MSLLDSMIYKIIEKIVNFLLLSVLWVVFSLPTVTIFPSTSALFAVVRDWHMGKEDRVLIPFIVHFKKNFKGSVFLSLIWIVIIGCLYYNFQMIQPLESIFYFLLTVITGIVTLEFFITSLYLFPVLVHFELPIINVIKNAFFIGLSQLKFTIPAIGIVLLAMLVIYHIPILMIFISGMIAYLLYSNCYEAFKKVGAEYE